MALKAETIDARNGRAPAGHPELDRIDLRLLEALQRNARSTYAELGALVGLKPPAVHDRVKRLENRGFVRSYAAQLDPRRVGYELTAFVGAYCAPDLDYDAFTAAIQTFPEVLEIHSVAGDETYVLKVVTRSTGHLDDFLTRLKRVPGVARTRTTIVLSTPFERGGLPVEALG
ncbi:AsnC family transcriptional regulator [Vulcanimicrobium alpinum]|uniref:AsnC family transcriptional regulator n=1 Tax=Vulcanimicrobium alpinum TaxID=3016050 RepID=A0AAN1XZ44_UNVUL|nr:Lrp/AsnC family transcriptional regulator [Vulcanimicrobium alpinum]BDE08043.1 AsnC family transcriptional regulator [Vulcanimicrobium alpinum]